MFMGFGVVASLLEFHGLLTSTVCVSASCGDASRNKLMSHIETS